MSYFKNKVVWITGASSGIGEYLAYEFARQGAKLILSSRRTSELERVKKQCAIGENCLIQALDMTDVQAFSKITENVWNHFGKIDLLINNAGISQRSLAKETVLEVDRRIMEVNFIGVVALTKALLPYFLEAQNGHFVVTSSVMGKIGTPQRTAYAASKHALHGFFDSLRAELIHDNIHVSILCPGYVQTNITKNALTKDGSKHNQTSASITNGYAPDRFAQKAVRAIAKRKEEIYIGGKEIMAIYIKRFFPKLWSYLATRLNVT